MTQAVSIEVTKVNINFKLIMPLFYFSEGSPIEDMSLIAQCNHSILTYGSFGFFGAFLKPSSALTAYPDLSDLPKQELYRFSKSTYEKAKVENFIPFPIK